MIKRLLFFSVFLFSFAQYECIAQPIHLQVDQLFIGKLKFEEGNIFVEDWTAITDSLGYRNQPTFSNDSKWMLYSSQVGKQTDIFQYNMLNEETTRLTETPELEFSPIPIEGGKSFSTVRLENDLSQRMWKYNVGNTKSAEPILPGEDSVGYHCWLSKKKLVFLKEPVFVSLMLVKDINKSPKPEIIDINVGRCLAKVPTQTGLNYVKKYDNGTANLMFIDTETMEAVSIYAMPNDTEDFAWTPYDRMLCASEGRILVLNTLKLDGWKDIGSTPNGKNVTRLAVSPDGNWICAVVEYQK